MDVRYINPFIEAVHDVFKTMLQIDVHVGKPELKNKSSIKCDASAVIGFSGELVGSVTLCFPARAATAVASKFAQIEITRENTEDLADALGELCNMVAGGSKTLLPGEDVSISLPRVVLGNGHETAQPRGWPVLILPFDCAMGHFWLEATMRNSRKKDPFAGELALVGQ